MEQAEPSTLSYAPPAKAPWMTKVLAVASLATALLGFPIGVAVTIFTGTHPEIFSHNFSERSGFMSFAVLEGVGVACGVLGALRARGRANRTLFRVAIGGMILGAIGTASVLLLIYNKAVR